MSSNVSQIESKVQKQNMVKYGIEGVEWGLEGWGDGDNGLGGMGGNNEGLTSQA